VDVFYFWLRNLEITESTLNNLNNMKKLSVIALVAVGLLQRLVTRKIG
jgi:hypothetical protein